MATVISSREESVPAVAPILGSRENTTNSSRRLLLLSMLAVALLVGLVSAWHGGSFTVGDDGVSYLDLSDAWRNHDWVTAANGCWSPGYPVLLAATLTLVHPSAFWEPLVIRGVNFLVYVGAIFAFAFFWKELTRSLARRAAAVGLEEELPNLSWLVLGFAFFLFFGGEFVGVSLVSPDLALFACVMLAIGMIIRVRDSRMNWALYATLGAVCAIGYLFKAIMFPLTFVFLGVAFLAAENKRSVAPRLALSFAVFILIASPWIWMLSHMKHRLDYSDVGKLNYLWFASEGFEDYGYPFPWKPAPGEGTPVHPMRDLSASPHVFEFRAPFRGSYPLWDDPAYWYEGAKIPFHFRQQLRTIERSIVGYFTIIEREGALLTGALFLLLAAGRRKAVLNAWYLVLPAAIALTFYAISHGLVQNRYMAPFLPIMWAAVFGELCLLHLKTNSRLLPPLLIAMAVIFCLPVVLNLSADVLQSARKIHSRTYFDHYDADVANYLQSIGVHSGDSLGYLQAPEDGTNKYWARLARTTIVADMSFQDVPAFWQADVPTQNRVFAAFRDAGVKAIVAYNAPASARNMGWVKVGTTNYYVLSGSNLAKPSN